MTMKIAFQVSDLLLFYTSQFNQPIQNITAQNHIHPLSNFYRNLAASSIYVFPQRWPKKWLLSIRWSSRLALLSLASLLLELRRLPFSCVFESNLFLLLNWMVMVLLRCLWFFWSRTCDRVWSYIPSIIFGSCMNGGLLGDVHIFVELIFFIFLFDYHTKV